MDGLHTLVVTTGIGWGGTAAWALSALAVLLLALAAWWVARPARRVPGRRRRYPGQRPHRDRNG